MDASTRRQRLREAYAELEELNERRDALFNIIKGHEVLIRLDGLPPVEAKPQPTLPLPKGRNGSEGPSFRAAVQRVLREARGEPLHIKEILVRAQGIGGVTKAKDPAHITDLMIYSLRTRNHVPIEKVAPATYRWAGDPEQPEPEVSAT